MKFIEYVKLPLKKSHTSCDPCVVLSQGGPRQEGELPLSRSLPAPGWHLAALPLTPPAPALRS